MLGKVKDLVRTVVPTSSARVFSARKLLLFGALLLACSGLAQTNATSAVVAVPVVNMFSAGNADSDVVSQAIYGTTVVMLGESSGWVKVRTPDQYSGWLRTDQVRLLSSSELPYATSAKTAQVSSLTANLYREPDVTKVLCINKRFN